ncbi:MAG: DoxX family protein [Nanoarchaeota archaeon]|nr:DoxX family protein [Nanoarchaeota archaeon]
MYIGKLSEKHKDKLYLILRVVVGFLFLQHGGQKLFGWFGGLGGSSAPLLSLMGLAGIIELFGGLMIVLGLFNRLAALLGAIEMLVAYFMVHFPQGWNPMSNGGELALLYFAAFLVILAMGNGKWSLERALLKKEMF